MKVNGENKKMKAERIISLFVVISLMAFWATGCHGARKTEAADVKSEDAQQEQISSKRFQGAGAEEQSTIDSTLKLAQDYAALSQKMMDMQQKSQKLVTENAQLRDRIAVLEPELKQTKKELDEANKLLVEMRIELNNWKVDILGFRDEIRQADKAQLETLLKILEVLGGEVKVPLTQAAPAQDSTTQAASTQAPEQAPGEKTDSESQSNTSGDPNE